MPRLLILKKKKSAKVTLVERSSRTQLTIAENFVSALETQLKKIQGRQRQSVEGLEESERQVTDAAAQLAAFH